MQTALSALRLTLSEPQVMTMNGHQAMAVKAFLPVFKNDPDGAPGDLQGFLIATIALDGFFNAFLDDTFDSTDLPLRVYDGNTLVFQHGALTHPLSPTALTVGNRQWRLEVDAEMQPIESTFWLPMLVFAIGLALTALLYLRLLRADTEYRRIADEVGRATAELASANRSLGERSATLQQVVDDLRRTSQEAQVANAAKTMFLANMSHELRTPLNAVIGFSEMIANRSLGENWSRYMEYARDILTSGRYLLSIIEDLLDMSRIELGQIELREEVIAPEELAQSAAKFIAHRAREKHSNIELAELADLPPVMVDVRAMRQSLTNLLANAVKFSEPGARVEIRGRATAEGEICFSVNDNGPGIKPSDLQHIFEPFWQNEAYRRRPRDGVGLGLAITKRFVEAHGGTIAIESREGAGTSIEIRLPAWRTVRGKPQFTVVQGERGNSAA
jgi:signal transduction histidine kinase